MAKNVELMGAVFPDCPAVLLPTHEGPLARFTDVSDSQAVAADVAQGKAFYLADGTKATGTNQGGGGGGGGGGTIKPNARLVLIDYDGSIVDSYTQSEINAMSALPANPDHSGDEIPLTSQGWNWTLAEVREQLAAMPEQTVWVGQTYIPTDGKTHIVIYIDENAPASRLATTLRFTQSVNNGVTVDWGDGSAPETFSGTSATNRNHTFARGGWLDVTLTVTSGTLRFDGNSAYSILGDYGANYTYRRGQIQKVFLGAGLATNGVGPYAFHYCTTLASVTVPTGVTNIGNYAFRYCENLLACVLPKGITTIGQGLFMYNHAFGRAAIPPDFPNTGNATFQECYRLEGITLLKKYTSLGSTALAQCHMLTSISIPAGVTMIDSNSLQNCYNLTSLTIPSGVTSIKTNAFGNDKGIAEYHFKPTTPPALGAANVFNGITAEAVIYVPYSEDHSILNAYKTASNWSNFASQIVEEAE